MSYSTTAKDLKLDALDLAGEPYDGSSQYEAFAYEWLTVIQRALVSGGQFGPSPLEPVDWLWARAWPRGARMLSSGPASPQRMESGASQEHWRPAGPRVGSTPCGTTP